MLRSLARFAAIPLLLAGCATTPVPDEGGVDVYAVVEPVLAWRQNAAGDLIVRVFSNGCTNKDSFEAVATGSPQAGWAFDVTLTRYFPDTCEAILPQGVELAWTRDELGLPRSARLTLTNPVDTFRTIPLEEPLS